MRGRITIMLAAAGNRPFLTGVILQGQPGKAKAPANAPVASPYFTLPEKDPAANGPEIKSVKVSAKHPRLLVTFLSVCQLRAFYNSQDANCAPRLMQG